MMLHHILMVRDRLTTGRGGGAQSTQMNGSDAVSCLECLEMFPWTGM